jgi:DNA-binding LytR/AlgR family response regulator
MKQITAVVADDERELLRHLKKMLADLWPELNIVAEAVNGPQTIEMVETLNPDIVFLDIKMPGCNGIEVARRICRKCMIVFITAFDQYAVNAFENEALDYILKPVSRDRLAKSLKRCRQRVMNKAMRDDLFPLLSKLEESLQDKRGLAHLQWIRAQHGDAIRLIPVDEVLAFRSSDKYTQVITAKKESLIRKPLKDLEIELDPGKFWKIHRGTIVNASAISMISKSMTGKYVIKLDGYEEPLMVSRSYTHLFRQM